MEIKPTIIRFVPAERWLHNIVMFSFILLLTTGLSMVYFNLIGENRDARDFLRTVHQVVSVLFVGGPLLIVLAGGAKIWRENIFVAINFRKDDFLWLIKTPFVGIAKNIVLPPQDKFNGGQKVWIYIVVTGALTLTVTGIFIWVDSSAILALFIHTAVTLIMIPPLAGHMYMALINKETRGGITSIVDGEVDSIWAQEHHPIWMDRKAKERVLEKAGDGKLESR